MPGVSTEQHLFSGSGSPVVFGNRFCHVNHAFESQDLPKSFHAEPPELSPCALTNMEYLQSLNLFSETSPNSEKSRYSKDSASVQKLFNKSLSFGSNSLSVDFSFTTTGMESENFLVRPRTMIKSLDGISSLHKFLPSNNEEEASWPAVDAYSCDEFRMYEFKVHQCMRGQSHDWTECPFAHPREKARRRDPRRFHYSSTGCVWKAVIWKAVIW